MVGGAKLAPRGGKAKRGARTAWPALLGGLSLILIASAARAEPVRLDEIVTDALQGSLSLQSAKNKIEAAKGQLLEAKSQFDWSTLAQTGWQRFLAPDVRNGALTGNVGYVDTWRTTVGVTKEFSNGISVSPGVTTLVTGGIRNLQQLGYQEVTPSVNLTVPIMRGLGEESASAGQRAADARVRGSELDYDYASQKAVHDAVQLFWRCLADAQQRMIMLQSDQQRTDFERWLQAMVGRGQMEPGTVQRAQADHALSNQELDQANEGVLRCRRQLSDTVGAKEHTLLEPVGELPHPERFGPGIDKLQVEKLIAYALDNRRDLRALKSYIEGQRDRIKGAKDELNPKIDVVLDPYQAFVRFSQSLNRYDAKGHIAEATADEGNAEIALEQARRAVRTDIANAVDALRQLWRSWPGLIGAQKKLETLEVETERRVRAGTADRRNLREVQDELSRAQHGVLDARLKLASIVASLRLYTGSLALQGDTSSTIATEFSTLPQP